MALTNQKFFLSQLSTIFHGRDLFAPVAAYLSLGVKPEAFGPELNSWVEFDFEKPRIRGRKLIGEILHIDTFGNLISNINEEQLFHFVKDHSFVTRIGGRAIQGLKKGYWEGKRNEVMALIGSGGFLEISVREGNAQKRLKAKKGNQIIIEISY